MPPIEWLKRRIEAGLAELEHSGLRRELRPPRGIDLCSNDYLGLSAHPLIKARMAEAVEQLGCGSTASRLLRGERECFDALEQRFARFKRTERALYFSSGYLANIAVLTAFPEARDVLYCDEFNHASLIDGARLSRAQRVIYSHLRAPEAAHQGNFIVTESLFSMDGDRALLGSFASAGAALIVDEAHAVGVFGERGSGWIEQCGAESEVFVSVNPAGKALGVAGAFVAGPAWAIEHLVQRARPFIFSTAPPPALAAALEASLDIIEAEPVRRMRLRGLARHLRSRLRRSGLDVAEDDSQIVPVIVGDNARAVAVARELQIAGFDVRAIRPPTVPPGTARLRVSVNVNATEEILDGFVAALEQSLCVASS